MTAPIVSHEQLQRVHEALRIAVPLDRASPMILSTLAVIAHCWRGRIPSNLWTDTELQNMPAAAKHQTTPAQRPAQLADAETHESTIDFKRRTAGDID